MTEILIVDDDKVMTFLLNKILGDMYTLHIVHTGEDAITFLGNQSVDLILLDIKMPGIDGFQTMEHLKRMPRSKDTPVLFLTGNDSSNVEIQALSAGGADYIRKPFVPDVVRLRVSHIIELDRLRKHLSEEVDKKTEALLQTQKKLEAQSVEIVQTLSGTIDAKDEYTNGHSERVAFYAREIARRHGYSEEEQLGVHLAGLLHDIGKIGIPDEIIRTPRKLTDEEFAIIKNHPSIGARILGTIRSIPNIAAGAHWHHERYDGTGYPDGLKGDEIPEVARIIAVADAYDAMTSNRSYRKYLPQEAVREEIRNGMGTQFDPVFAEIMLQMIDEDSNYHMMEPPVDK